MSPATTTTIRLPRGKRRHATSRDDVARTACGRLASGGRIDEGDPDCMGCLRVIRATLAAEGA